jgi:hypothetical protein
MVEDGISPFGVMSRLYEKYNGDEYTYITQNIVKVARAIAEGHAVEKEYFDFVEAVERLKEGKRVKRNKHVRPLRLINGVTTVDEMVRYYYDLDDFDATDWYEATEEY